MSERKKVPGSFFHSDKHDGGKKFQELFPLPEQTSTRIPMADGAFLVQ